jgi:hypothetical protein
VLTFDYRGWGASDSRLILVDGALQPVREVVDPLDMAADILNAIHWMVGEPEAVSPVAWWCMPPGTIRA